MKHFLSILSITICLLFFAYCTPKIAKVASTPAVDSTTVIVKTYSEAQLHEGREIMVNNCAKCHVLFEPEDFKSNEWKEILVSMIPKAKLSDYEAELVTAYILENAADKINK